MEISLNTGWNYETTVDSNEEIKISEDLIEMYSGEFVANVFVYAVKIETLLNDDTPADAFRYVNYNKDLIIGGEIYKAMPLEIGDDIVEKSSDVSLKVAISLPNDNAFRKIISEDEKYIKSITIGIYRDNKLEEPLFGLLKLNVDSFNVEDNIIGLDCSLFKGATADVPKLKYTKEVFKWL